LLWQSASHESMTALVALFIMTQRRTLCVDDAWMKTRSRIRLLAIEAMVFCAVVASPKRTMEFTSPVTAEPNSTPVKR
jgi:hypothetical protein